MYAVDVKHTLRLLLYLLPVLCWAQYVDRTQVLYVSADPSGSCGAGYITVNSSTGAVSYCSSGTWAIISGTAGSTTPHVITFRVDGGTATFSTGPIGAAFEADIASATGIYKVVVSGSAVASGTAQTACSMTMDIWKHSASVPVVVGDKISASAPATLSSALQNVDTTLTGWTTSVAVGDYFTGNVVTNTTCLSATVQIWYR